MWWKCNEGHEWSARLDHRKGGSGCPYCSGHALIQSNSLSNAHPNISKLWHPEKNKISPHEVFRATTQVFWWLCENGHEWKASVANRTRRNDKCPYCSGKIANEETCLQTRNPEISKEWNYQRNGSVTPNDVTLMSNKKVWWLCEKGHEWRDKICSRVSGNRCSVCFPRTPKKVVSSDYNLKVVQPHLMIEWHPIKNENMDPSTLSPVSGKKVWWKCKECNHEWKASIDNRKKGRGCSKCNIGQSTSFPEQCLFYYLSKVFLNCKNRHVLYTQENKPIEIDIYIPKLNLAIEYDGYYYHKNRMKQDEEKNCKLKEMGIGFIRIRENNGANKRLPIIKKYGSVEIQCNSEKEEDILEAIKKILEVSGMDLDASLLRKMDINIHKDRMIIYSLAKKNEKERSLAFLHPTLAKEWHVEKNMELTAWNVLPGSSKRVFWICNSCSKEWEAIINKRVNGQTCPYCAGKKAGPVRSLQSECSNMAAMWHPTKNGALTTKDVLPGSKIEAWWLCSKCNMEWEEPVYRRTSRKGCPYCNGKRVYWGNCLATIKPDIAKMWHPTKNINLTPFNVTSSSGKMVWWLCECGKEYEKPIHRMKKNGCWCK